MLVLKQIHGKGNNSNYYVVGYEHLYSVTSHIQLELYDTDKDLVFTTKLDDVKNDIFSIFGVVINHKNVILFEVEDKLWNLLDYINSPKYVGRIKNFDKFLNSQYGECTLISNNCKLFFDYYRSSTKDIAVVLFPQVLHSLDINMIFYEMTLEYNTLYSLYEKAFSLCTINEYMDVYTVDDRNEVFKLDINKEVVRYFTKLKSLKRL